MQRQRSSFFCVLALKRKWVANFFLRELKKNTETTEQDQDISLCSKEITPPEPFAFKGFPFPTNTMTKNPASVSHLKLKQTESLTKYYDAEFTIKEEPR